MILLDTDKRTGIRKMDIIKSIIDLYAERSKFFLDLLWQHIVLSAIAIVIITILGVSLGILITKYKRLSGIVLGICNFMYTIPSIALFGFLVAITGIGAKTALIAIIIYGLLPVIRNTYTGIKEVDEKIIEAAVGMGTPPAALLFRIKLPLASPVIIAGIRTMVVMTIAMVGIASFIGAGGLGVAIWRGITTNNVALTIAGSILIAALALLADFLVGRIEKISRKKVLGR